MDSTQYNGPFNTNTDVAAINAVLDVSFESPLYPYGFMEPVSLDDVKNYMKIDFDDDDVLITDLITVARELLETYTGLSLIQKQATVQLNNGCSGIELPYGPIPGGAASIDPTLVTDSCGNQIECLKLTGNQFVTVQSPCSPFIQFIYSTGFVPGTIPTPILMGIRAQTFFLYENRGEKAGYSGGGVRSTSYNATYVCDAAKQFCKRYCRNTELSL